MLLKSHRARCSLATGLEARRNFYDETNTSGTRHPKILRAANTNFPALDEMRVQLHLPLDREDETAARQILFDVVTRSDKIHQA